MGYLIHFALAFAALAVAESGLGSWTELPLGVAALGLVPHLLLAATRRACLRGRFRTGALLERLMIGSPPVLYFAALVAFGWLDSVARWTGVETRQLTWPHPAELVALAPFVLYGLASIDARARVGDMRDSEVARTRRFHQRMFATGGLPLTVFVLAAWAVSANESVRVHLEEVALLGAATGGLVVLAFVLGLPLTLAWLWDTQRMAPGIQRDALQELAQRASFRCRAILVWVTGHRMANVAVIGLESRTRLVLFTDALLTQLSLRELRAVFAHEMGHVHYRHALTFLAWALAYFLFLDLASAYLPELSEVVALSLLIASILVWWLGFGWLSRRAEQEADLFSLELTGDLVGLVCALERVGGAHPRRRSSWRHFSTELRVAHLVRAQQDPELGRRHHRRLRRIGKLGVGLMIATLALEGWQLSEAYPTDRLRADMRLGNYADARVRLGGLALPDEDRALFERALLRARQVGDRADSGELERAARTALIAGELESALDYATLAYWRGAVGLDPLIEVLDATVSGRVADPRVRAAVPGKWAADLERALRTGSR